MSDTESRHWDVVVLGAGGSGTAAAIEAHDAGASVLILEKQSADQHLPTTALLAGGLMFSDDLEGASTYLGACAGDLVPPAVTSSWAQELQLVADWVSNLDGHSFRLGDPYDGAEYPGLPGAASIRSAHGQTLSNGEWNRAGGQELFAALQAARHRRGIEVRFSTAAERLIVRDEAVVGVAARGDDGSEQTFGASSVVLATGGFGFDPEMKRQFLTGGADVHLYGSPAATGDGIRMAQAVGADLWHMGVISGRGVGHFLLPDGQVLNTILLLDLAWLGDDQPFGYVIVDGSGERFADESAQARLSHSFYYEMLHYDPHRGDFPRIPSYWIFDSRRFDAGPLTIPGYGTAGVIGHEWSSDNRTEVDLGWIVEADTIGELAERIGLPSADVLAQTLSDYNDHVRLGADPFRTQEPGHPVDHAPYYAVPLWPGGTNTAGGPRRDGHGRVVHALGGAIPGLYGCGEGGQVMGARYPGQYAYYGEALCTGRIAGRTAAREALRRRAT